MSSNIFVADFRFPATTNTIKKKGEVVGIENIEHVVVVMMENRSFDNLLGWLYDADNPPALNIPPQTPPTFFGLSPNTCSNTLNGKTIFASQPPTAWPPANNPNLVPTPDPQEVFDHVTAQIGSAAPTVSLLDSAALIFAFSAGNVQIEAQRPDLRRGQEV